MLAFFPVQSGLVADLPYKWNIFGRQYVYMVNDGKNAIGDLPVHKHSYN